MLESVTVSRCQINDLVGRTTCPMLGKLHRAFPAIHMHGFWTTAGGSYRETDTGGMTEPHVSLAAGHRRRTLEISMSWACRLFATSVFVVSLVAPGFMPCACSEGTGTPQQHCSSPGSGFRSAPRGCDCACMIGRATPEAIDRTAVSSAPVSVVTQLVLLLDTPRPPVVESFRGSTSLFPSPPLAPPLVLRV